jgi:SHS2 domain-containing protein
LRPVTAPAYRLLDHTADIAFEVEAATWPELLVAATRALGDVILRDDGRPATEERPVAVEGADREDVVVAWLGEALYLYERDGFLARDARVEADATSARGRLLGRVARPDAEPPDRVVKAVTYHDLRIEEGGDGRPWRTTVVLDL